MSERRRERRYPPTPYPPHSDATRTYRDGYDLGWRFVGQKGRLWALAHWLHMGGANGSPSQVGYADGARARLEADARAKAVDPDVARMNRELDEKWRREEGSEPPY